MDFFISKHKYLCVTGNGSEKFLQTGNSDADRKEFVKTF
jgi:hypothetical protein